MKENNVKMDNFIFTNNDGIATLTVDRPEVRNALNSECWKEISGFIDIVESDSSIKVAIITGSGEKAFISGADINFLKERTSVTALDGVAQNVCTKISKCTKPIIAAINGVAYGAGLEIALACDIRISSDNAKFALPELGIGILPGAGGTQRLSRVIGVGRAMDMILTSRRIDSTEALQMGLISRVTSYELLAEEANKMAQKIMSKGPLAVRISKQVVNASMSTDIDTGLLLELLSYSVLVSSDDRMEGVEAFLNKREANFSGK